MPPGKQPAAPLKKTTNWTLPTVLGLILSVVGAVGIIELLPQMSVSPQELLATGQPFSAPFELTNTGYLGIHIDNVIAIFHRLEYPGGANFIDFIDFEYANVAWDDFDLERGQSKTLLPYFSNGRPEKADIVISIDYRYFGWKGRSFFRFVGIHMDNWTWSKQPLGSLKPEINKAVDQALVKHRQFTQKNAKPN